MLNSARKLFQSNPTTSEIYDFKSHMPAIF